MADALRDLAGSLRQRARLQGLALQAVRGLVTALPTALVGRVHAELNAGGLVTRWRAAKADARADGFEGEEAELAALCAMLVALCRAAGLAVAEYAGHIEAEQRYAEARAGGLDEVATSLNPQGDPDGDKNG